MQSGQRSIGYLNMSAIHVILPGILFCAIADIRFGLLVHQYSDL